LGIGSVTALIGILYATTENHLKRMLAHSSIENMGLITVALGAALTFQASHLPALAFIAWVAALYQMLNHSVYKSLLFLSAGAVDLATGDLDMNHLGGLARVMPWTSVLALFGVMSISALPPFSGFISEWLILQTLLRSVSLQSPVFQVMFALSGVIVALTAGLAATAFIKFYGMTFLGPLRSPASRQAREVSSPLLWAMATLAALCLALGILPTYVIRFLSPLVAALGGGHHLAGLVPAFFSPGTLPPALVATFKPLGAESGRRIFPGPGLAIMHQSSATIAPHVVFASSPFYLAVTTALFLGILYGVLRLFLKKRAIIRRQPWQGGLAALPENDHYSATGFSNPIRVIFRAILSPSHSLDQEILVENHFHTAVRRTPNDSYVIDRWLFYPIVTLAVGLSKLLGRMHHGNINNYIFYAFATLLLVLSLSVLR
jgi:hydrogenase-4 component B